MMLGVRMKNKLQELRWKRNWSQNQLAIRSNVSQSVISSIENNQLDNPRIMTALKLAKALSVSVEDIFQL